MNALDELRFGPQRTLNLREGLPSSSDAARRAENWLREHQVQGTKEVLVITGRGSQSIGGVAVIRPAIERLLFALRRRGVITGHQEHNPGAFAVQLASLRSLVEAPPRNRDRAAPRPDRLQLHGLSRETNDLLRVLAERSLDALGVSHDDSRVSDEMQRQLRAIAPGLRGGQQMESDLRTALAAALAEFD